MKISGLLLFFILSGFLYARDVELVIVKETRDPEFSEKKFRSWTRFFPKDARSIDASRLARPKELFHIKRIVIPAAPRIFSPEMIDGMIQYVADGGLIITESIMNGIDANGDFREDFSLFQAPAKRKKGHPRPNGWPPSGVIAHSSMKIESVTAVIECPLSKGFTVSKPMPVSFSFRNVIRADGNVIFTASAVARNGRRKGSMPLASVYNVGKGTFVFIPFQIETLVKNALSAETLDWLTDQE